MNMKKSKHNPRGSLDEGTSIARGADVDFEVVERVSDQVTTDPKYSDDIELVAFMTGVQKYVKGKCKSIDEALNLKPKNCGEHSVRRVSMYDERNEFLRKARTCFAAVKINEDSNEKNIKPWVMSGYFSEEVNQFYARWKKEELDNLDEPDNDWSALTKNLFLAFKCSQKNGYIDIPTGQNQFHNIHKKYLEETPGRSKATDIASFDWGGVNK